MAISSTNFQTSDELEAHLLKNRISYKKVVEHTPKKRNKKGRMSYVKKVTFEIKKQQDGI